MSISMIKRIFRAGAANGRRGLLAAVAVYCFMTAPTAQAADSVFESRWWAPDSFWNQPIGNAQVAPYSLQALRAYQAIEKPINMNWDSAAVALVYADSRTDPKADITFTNYPDWLWTFPSVPQNADLIRAVSYRLQAGNTDGMTCLYDAAKKGFYSFWKPTLNADGKTISIRTGAFNPADGMGGSDINQFTPSGGRVAGTSYCGGIIRPQEMEAGLIRHSLAMVWPNNLNRSYAAAKAAHVEAKVYPATHTDGQSESIEGTIPMGARLQLDPALTDDQLQSLGLVKPADLVIAHALQIYGAYVVDSNTRNANAGFYFESGYGRGAQIYKATNPWPAKLVAHMRFVEGPTPGPRPLDTAKSVGLPIRIE